MYILLHTDIYKKKKRNTNIRTHEKFNNSRTLDSLLLSFFSRFSHLAPALLFSVVSASASWRCLPDLLLSMNILRRRRAAAARIEGRRTHFVYYVYFVYICIWAIRMYVNVDVERIYLSACHFNNLHDVLSSLQISYSHTCPTLHTQINAYAQARTGTPNTHIDK